MVSLRQQVLLTLTTFIIGCTSPYVSLNDGYYLMATDSEYDMHLGCEDGDVGVGVIEETVFAVGQDEHFIIVKQHPRKFPDEPDRFVTNYYIIPKENPKGLPCYENKIGPLSEEKFMEYRKDYRIADELEFTIVFSALE